MRAIVYTRAGDPEVLQLVERPVPEPGPGEVGVKVHVAGVNPTDWKSRRREPEGEIVPGQDGAGVVDAVGEGVAGLNVGERVWVYLAQWQRPGGTAQEQLVLPRQNVVPLPDGAAFDLGAGLGVPAMTAHRALTVADGGPDRLSPGALDGRTVLVAGGAGAVGNATIQLARWAGATVLATVSGPRKAELAEAAGAHHVVNYRDSDAATAIRDAVPHGVDLVVEVAAAANAKLNAAVLADHGTVAVYGAEGGDELVLSARDLFRRNIRYQGLILYTIPDAAKEHAAADVSAAVAAGALKVGEEAGLPLHHFPLEKAGEAHAAVEAGAVGKVLIDVG